MLERIARRLYEKLGRHYQLVFLVTQGPAAVVVGTVAIAVILSYYDPPFGKCVLIIGACALSTLLAVGFAALKGAPYLARVNAWQASEHPTPAESIAAWDAATNFPVRSFRRNVVRVGAIAALPTIAATVLTLDLRWTAIPVLLAATFIPVAYGTVLNYAIAELLMRPVVQDIAAVLPVDFPFTANGLPVRKRLIIALPVYTAFAGLASAALLTGREGTSGLALSLLVAMVVGVMISFELTVLLSGSITAPIGELRRALARVRAGDFAVTAPVVTSDELGELSHDFNLFTHGLAEREQLREAFGTYLDKDVARLLLSGQFPQAGIEVEVSIMFCDVRGFTSFAERSEAPQVVAALNALFETIVPIVDRHGGHVDKFMGDGLLAVFGAPEGYTDHADRAVGAALDIVRAVNTPGAELRVGAGVNSGSVVAGSIGGAGRLNFSVIGDAVNVAARVEAATRQTGDDILITCATRDLMVRPVPVASRGSVDLKGKADPLEVLCPLVDDASVGPAAPASTASATGS